MVKLQEKRDLLAGQMKTLGLDVEELSRKRMEEENEAGASSHVEPEELPEEKNVPTISASSDVDQVDELEDEHMMPAASSPAKQTMNQQMKLQVHQLKNLRSLQMFQWKLQQVHQPKNKPKYPQKSLREGSLSQKQRWN